ncbi:MAG: NAD(P)/FAD-dependent oxidoreductase [Bacteroidota bacterium]|nr:NAD(P)/FAD-dependent oxidoreductase [Bacteroidota bacterium]
MDKKDYDAIVVGSGPNGLAAAILLQQNGLSVLLIEGKREIGGGLSSRELTLPGFIHDTCSAIHPLAAGSPFFTSLPLEAHGLQFVYPAIDAAHPFDDGRAAFLMRSVQETAKGLNDEAYLTFMQPLVKDWPRTIVDVLAPLHFPKSPLAMARFGIKALGSASHLVERFSTKESRGLWAGMSAHAMQSLKKCATSAIGLVLLAAGHTQGWPVAVGGSYTIARALTSYFVSLGGRIETGLYINSLDQLPSAKAILLDITPKQLLSIAGYRFSSFYKSQLERFRYGMGIFKIDWALDEPIPFKSISCRQSGTVHLGNTFEEIEAAEQMVWNGKHPEKPFVILAQQSLFDHTRAPAGKHTGWAYCHVPNGSTLDMTKAIEQQVERFAPGFRERILAKHIMNTEEMEAENPNYIGGDINGGAFDLDQLFARPALRFSPYRTSAKGIYICSSSTPPGGGVHGMCGYHAAKRVLKDIFPTVYKKNEI